MRLATRYGLIYGQKVENKGIKWSYIAADCMLNKMVLSLVLNLVRCATEMIFAERLVVVRLVMSFCVLVGNGWRIGKNFRGWVKYRGGRSERMY